ncbi:MAG: hypothetical protein SFY32_07030 [Bacteroidota bacterium]|nr:hypothetical protein [Bacteroidota bacterium]
MTYHLPRVMHWIQNNNINHYNTNIIWQVYQPPYAEYCILNNILMTGHINSANIVQNFAYINSLVIVSLILKEFGSDFKTQLLGSCFGSLMSMVILQATSTQNDLLMAYFTLATTWFMLKLFNTKNPIFLIFISITAGLSLITKGIGFQYLAPVFFIISFYLIPKIKQFFLYIIVSVLFIFLIMFPHYYRNFEHFGHPLGDINLLNIHKNEIYNLVSLISLTIKNYAMNLCTLSNRINSLVYNIVVNIHEFIGFDINESKSNRALWSDSVFNNFHYLYYDEDYAPNLFSFVLFPLLLVYAFIKGVKEKLFWIYTFIIIFGFILLSFTLKWSPWNTRYHLITALLFVPIIIYNITNKKIALLIVIIGISLSYKFVFNRTNKEILPFNKEVAKTDIDVLFTKKMDMKNEYVKAVDLIQSLNITKLGIILFADDWEFPIWYLTQQKNIKIHIQHVNNLTKFDEIPTDIITFEDRSLFVVNGIKYRKISNNNRLNLFHKI